MVIKKEICRELCLIDLVCIIIAIFYKLQQCCKITGTSFGKKHISTEANAQTDDPFASFGGRHTVTLIPGDGVGPELAHSVKQIFRCVKYCSLKGDTGSYDKRSNTCLRSVYKSVSSSNN